MTQRDGGGGGGGGAPAGPAAGAVRGPARPVDWERRWTAAARLLRPARVARIVERFQGVPGIIGMHGGLPPADAFPLDALSFGLAPAAGGGALELSCPKDAAAAQQYCFAPHGYEPLRRQLSALTARLQRPPGPFAVTVTCGSTHGLAVALDLILERGEPLLVEEYTYSHALEAQLLPKGYELIPVPMDSEGMVPSALDDIIAARVASGAAPPRAVYAIPSGQNPTGAAMGASRRAQIYEVARARDLIIIEDDAYAWLQYPRGEGDVPGLAGLQPGLLSLDMDGRVVRLDTFSKTLGPGLRLGWLTAAPAFAARAGLAIASSTLGPASLSHVYMSRLLTHWGDSGLEGFVSSLQRKYARQAALADAAATRHLSGLASWRTPDGGMFMWLRLEAVADAMALLEAGAAARVAVVPGALFHVAGAAAAAAAAAAAGSEGGAEAVAAAEAAQPPCPYFRVSFVSVPEAELDEGFARLAAAIRGMMAANAAAAAAAGANGLAAVAANGVAAVAANGVAAAAVNGTAAAAVNGVAAVAANGAAKANGHARANGNGCAKGAAPASVLVECCASPAAVAAHAR